MENTLLHALSRYFSDEELRTLCFGLGVDYDSLPGEGRDGKARELVDYLARRQRLGGLQTAIRQARPQAPLSPQELLSSVTEEDLSNGGKGYRVAMLWVTAQMWADSRKTSDDLARFDNRMTSFRMMMFGLFALFLVMILVMGAGVVVVALVLL